DRRGDLEQLREREPLVEAHAHAKIDGPGSGLRAGLKIGEQITAAAKAEGLLDGRVGLGPGSKRPRRALGLDRSSAQGQAAIEGPLARVGGRRFEARAIEAADLDAREGQARDRRLAGLAGLPGAKQDRRCGHAGREHGDRFDARERRSNAAALVPPGIRSDARFGFGCFGLEIGRRLGRLVGSSAAKPITGPPAGCSRSPGGAGFSATDAVGACGHRLARAQARQIPPKPQKIRGSARPWSGSRGARGPWRKIRNRAQRQASGRGMNHAMAAKAPEGYGRNKDKRTGVKLWLAVVSANLIGLFAAVYVSSYLRAGAGDPDTLFLLYYGAMVLAGIVDAVWLDEVLFKGAFRRNL